MIGSLVLYFIKSLRLSIYRALTLEVVVVGGDGLFHEVANGLLRRADGMHMPIGIIPSGGPPPPPPHHTTRRGTVGWGGGGEEWGGLVGGGEC